MVKYSHTKNKHNSRVLDTGVGNFADGKETAVKIRGNSHYRYSRNAYRFVPTIWLLGKGEAISHHTCFIAFFEGRFYFILAASNHN